MKKKVAAGVAVTVAAASVATNIAFTPDELLHSAAYLDSHTKYVESGELIDQAIEYIEPEELSRADSLRVWFLKLPVPVKALFLLPLWAIGAIPVAIGTGLLEGVSPILAHIASFLLQAGVLVGVFCAVYKLIFPNRKVTELFTKKKNRRWLLAGAFGVTAANLILSVAWDGWPVWRVAIMVAAGFGILCLLWYRICHGLKGPERKMVKRRLRLEYGNS